MPGNGYAGPRGFLEGRGAPKPAGRSARGQGVDRAAAGAVTVVTAPAGSGKSSLLRAWADRQDPWMTFPVTALESHPNDPGCDEAEATR